jgi:hypothetical protein
VDAALSEDREKEGVEDGKDTEDGEGNANIGYYISCAGHCGGWALDRNVDRRRA